MILVLIESTYAIFRLKRYAIFLIFLLDCHSNHGPIFHRFGDTATYWLKIANNSYPSLIRRPAPMFLLEVRGEVIHEETTVLQTILQTE